MLNMKFSKLLFAFFLLILVMECINMMTSASQKVVLISGATSGIGLAAVKAFHEKGWKVWAGYHKNVSNELKQIDKV